jgi:hypothetical protein
MIGRFHSKKMQVAYCSPSYLFYDYKMRHLFNDIDTTLHTVRKNSPET